MNPRSLNRSEVAVFAKNAAAAVAAGKVTGLSPAESEELSAKLNAGADKLSASDKKVAAAAAAYHEATELAAMDEADVLETLTGLKFRMRGTKAASEEYLAVGFDPPADPSNRLDPKTPSNLSAVGQSNGVNLLKYKGNNTPGGVIFTIHARTSLTDEYVMIGSTRRQSYRHEPVTPGQFYQYRVRAEASRGRTSDWSNETVVYPPDKR